jgi:hypothetical protein
VAAAVVVGHDMRRTESSAASSMNASMNRQEKRLWENAGTGNPINQSLLRLWLAN